MKYSPLSIRSKIGILNIFLKGCAKKVLKIQNWNFQIFATMSIKLRPLKVFEKLHKSPILIVNIVIGAVSGLRQFLASETPWKIMKNTFHFSLPNWIFYWQIRLRSYCTYSLNQMSDIGQVWKYWPLKDGSRSISQKFYRVAILWWVDQKPLNF